MITIQNSYRFGGGESDFLLDNYSNGLIAISLKKLSSTYSGYGLKIRRSSDNAEADVELYNNSTDSIDLSSTVSVGGDLGTFIGVNNGYVVTWYDQSGNGNDVTNTGTIANSKFIMSGVVEQTLNSLNNCVTIDSGKFSRTALTELADGNDISIFSVNDATSLSDRLSSIVSTGVSNADRLLQGIDTRLAQKANLLAITSGTNASATLFADIDRNETQVLTGIIKGGIKSLSSWNNAIAGGQNQVWTGTYGNTTLDFFHSSNGAITYVGKAMEIIIFSDDKTSDRADIETQINGRYGAY
jgi:hypothetical protein